MRLRDELYELPARELIRSSLVTYHRFIVRRDDWAL